MVSIWWLLAAFLGGGYVGVTLMALMFWMGRAAEEGDAMAPSLLELPPGR